MSTQEISPLCSTCLEALQPAQAAGYYENATPAGQSLEKFREATAGSCFICTSLEWIKRTPGHTWKGMDEHSWRPVHFQIEREDSDGEPATFTIHVVYSFPSDDKNWDYGSSSWRLIRLDGMTVLDINFTSWKSSARG